MSCGLWIQALEQNITRTHHRPPGRRIPAIQLAGTLQATLLETLPEDPRIRGWGVPLKPRSAASRAVALGGGDSSLIIDAPHWRLQGLESQMHAT